MTIQYQIFELDSNHLKRHEGLYKNQDRVCLMSARLSGGWDSDAHETFEEAVKAIEKFGKQYVEYTIIPLIYKTSEL